MTKPVLIHLHTGSALIVAQLGSGGNIVRYDLLAAGSVLATWPYLCSFALQKQFVASIMAGAIK